MTEIQERLEELKDLGLYRRTRLVSGPQGAHVLLDGKPVCCCAPTTTWGSPTTLASVRRPRRGMRWGVGAGASRSCPGTMTSTVGSSSGWPTSRAARPAAVRLRLPRQHRLVAAARASGRRVFSDALNHASIVDGCRLVPGGGVRLRPLRHRAPEWGIDRREGRGALIVTDSVFSMDGDVAPLAEIADWPTVSTPRVVVDEAHGTGTIGPGGRGAVAAAGFEDEIDVIVGTLGKALGAYGAFAACDRPWLGT